MLTGGPRRNNEVYDIAEALRPKLTDAEWTQLRDVLDLVERTAEEVGLGPWDHAPTPAPMGLVKTAVSAGLLDEDIASTMTKDEILAAIQFGYADGVPNKAQAMEAALRASRASGAPPRDPRVIFIARQEPRCGAILPRAGVPRIRREGHPGDHRSTP